MQQLIKQVKHTCGCHVVDEHTVANDVNSTLCCSSHCSSAKGCTVVRECTTVYCDGAVRSKHCSTAARKPVIITVGAEKNSIITIDGSTFISNTANYYGGAGGAVASLTSSVTIWNSRFINNTASDGGGAVGVQSSNISIDNCTFINNKFFGLGRNGGALGCTDSIAAIQNCRFINNTGQNGGAVFLFDNTKCSNNECYCSVGTIDNSTLTNNNASKGAAIYVLSQLV